MNQIASETTYVEGREGLKIPAIDESYAEISDVRRFFDGLYQLNHATNPSQPPESQELVIPATADKPLVVVRGNHIVRYEDDGIVQYEDGHRSIDTNTMEREILIPREVIGPFKKILTYWAEVNNDEFAKRLGLGFREQFSYLGKSVLSGEPAEQLEEKLSNRAVYSALKDTTELLLVD